MVVSPVIQYVYNQVVVKKYVDGGVAVTTMVLVTQTVESALFANPSLLFSSSSGRRTQRMGVGVVIPRFVNVIEVVVRLVSVAVLVTVTVVVQTLVEETEVRVVIVVQVVLVYERVVVMMLVVVL